MSKPKKVNEYVKAGKFKPLRMVDKLSFRDIRNWNVDPKRVHADMTNVRRG